MTIQLARSTRRGPPWALVLATPLLLAALFLWHRSLALQLHSTSTKAVQVQGSSAIRPAPRLDLSAEVWAGFTPKSVAATRDEVRLGVLCGGGWTIIANECRGRRI